MPLLHLKLVFTGSANQETIPIPIAGGGTNVVPNPYVRGLGECIPITIPREIPAQQITLTHYNWSSSQPTAEGLNNTEQKTFSLNLNFLQSHDCTSTEGGEMSNGIPLILNQDIVNINPHSPPIYCNYEFQLARNIPQTIKGTLYQKTTFADGLENVLPYETNLAALKAAGYPGIPADEDGTPASTAVLNLYFTYYNYRTFGNTAVGGG